MSSASLELLLRRDRRIVVSALVVLMALAWVYLISLAQSISITGSTMPDMPGMDMSSTMSPMLRAWTASDFLFIFMMWAIMMVGMMTPSATPMILIYARVARQAVQEGRPFAATGWFVSGYLFSWAVFSFLAAIAQGALERVAWLTPMMAAASTKVGGVVLIVAGIYQFTPLKNNCLSQCQSPFAFIQANGGFRRGTGASIQLGMRHGFYCIGCCWALMALLFVGGVMNILWIAAIAIFVLIEKAVPAGGAIARVAGVGLAFAGIWLLFK
jgi:predicted metal-binding membrane protein